MARATHATMRHACVGSHRLAALKLPAPSSPCLRLERFPCSAGLSRTVTGRRHAARTARRGDVVNVEALSRQGQHWPWGKERDADSPRVPAPRAWEALVVLAVTLLSARAVTRSVHLLLPFRTEPVRNERRQEHAALHAGPAGCLACTACRGVRGTAPLFAFP